MLYVGALTIRQTPGQSIDFTPAFWCLGENLQHMSPGYTAGPNDDGTETFQVRREYGQPMVDTLRLDNFCSVAHDNKE